MMGNSFLAIFLSHLSKLVLSRSYQRYRRSESEPSRYRRSSESELELESSTIEITIFERGHLLLLSLINK